MTLILFIHFYASDEYMKDKNKDKIKISMTLDIPNIDLYIILNLKNYVLKKVFLNMN